MKEHWSNQKERGSPFLVRFIFLVAMKLGRKITRILLYPITFYFLVAAPIQRRASREYFSRLWNRRATYFDGAKH
ncbi:MAG: lipid A biosynthesis acyltransferase, partial [Proteobacteria bacterium]|nr:lipid A biosynthesis acyltransferase [Pseudomonadota bacterium]